MGNVATTRVFVFFSSLTEWQEWGPVWTLNSVDRSHMYCVVVLHISYDNRLSTARYEVTTQRHVRIAAQRWSEHRMESRRRRHAVSGSAQFVYYILYSVPEEEWVRDDGSATTLVDIVTRTACCSDQRLLSFILHIFNSGDQVIFTPRTTSSLLV